MTELLKEIYEKKMTPEEFMKIYKFQPFLELGDVCLDLHRSLRKGFPEVVFCPGKSLDRIKKIARNLYRYHRLVLLTKADLRIARSLKKIFPKLKYFPEARIILIGRKRKKTGGKTGVITGGSSDIPIAEEAAVTCEVMGREVKRFYDVGVAGIHRLTHIIDEIARCQVLIVVAGMEGALPSIISGIVNIPVIGVPTSIGYGTNLGGIAPLLTMLNSCAPGLSVVNIDNGFGAGYLASLITR